MPKVITTKQRKEILAYVKEGGKQSEAARKFGVSFCFVNNLVHGRTYVRNRNVNRCVITGFRL